MTMESFNRIYLTIESTGLRNAEAMAEEFRMAIGKDPHADVPVIDELCKRILQKYSNNWCYYSDAGDTVETIKNRENDFISKMKTIFSNTWDRYFRLLTYYDKKATSLLDKIQTSSAVKFNDTPQNLDPSSAGDEWLSTLTKTESETDAGDAMTLLRGVWANYKNLYAEWLDEFAPLFANNILY